MAQAKTYSNREDLGGREEAWLSRELAVLCSQLSEANERTVADFLGRMKEGIEEAHHRDEVVAGAPAGGSGDAASAAQAQEDRRGHTFHRQTVGKKSDWESRSATKGSGKMVVGSSFSDSDLQQVGFSIGAVNHEVPRLSLADKVGRSLAGSLPAGSLFIRLVDEVARCLTWLDSIREPPRTGMLAKFAHSNGFVFVCILCIFLNALFIIYTTDYEMQHLAEHPTDFMLTVEFIFMSWYVLELCVKLLVHRCYFFANEDMKWNICDLILVTFSVVENVLYVLAGALEADGEPQGPVNLTFLRSFRVFKVAKVIRVFRTLRFFSDLRLMMNCMLGSMMNLFWCLAMLMFVLYVFALLFVQGLTQLLRDDASSLDQEQKEKLFDYFGSVSGAITTLLQSTTSGIDWRDVHKALVSTGSLFLPWLFVFYILFFVIAAWNIVTSAFVEKALKLAQPDLETLTLEQSLKDMADAEELFEIFRVTKSNGSQAISFEEFQQVTQHPKFRAYLNVRGIDIKNAELFYLMLRSISGGEEVDTRTLVNTCLKIKGLATSIDLHSLSFETKLLSRKHQVFMKEAMFRLDRIEVATSNLREVQAEVQQVQQV